MRTQPSSEKKGAAQAWLLQSPPGLASWLRKEMVYTQIIDRKADPLIKRQRNHDLLFVTRLRTNGDLQMEKLRLAEAVYRCPIFGRYKISKRQLDVAADELKAQGPRRLITQVAGRQFDRRDLGRWLEKELVARGAVIDPEIEDEVWMFCIDEAFYFGIPVAKARVAGGRENRIVEREASLPAPIAAAVAFAGQANSSDVIVDPVCGSGSLLAEAHAYAPAARMIGVDIDLEAITAARENLVSAFQRPDEQLNLICADSTTFNFGRRNDISLMLANLPFGLRYGDKKTNAVLYEKILRNLLAQADLSRFRAVLLTSDTESLRSALQSLSSDLESQDLFRVKIRGELATAVIVKARGHR